VLKSECHKLKSTVHKLQSNLDMLSHHNSEKNREVEFLLSNRGDYLPVRHEAKPERTTSALDRTSSTLSPRSHRHLLYL
jgi:tryptophan 2,3-dioxygenase